LPQTELPENILTTMIYKLHDVATYGNEGGTMKRHDVEKMHPHCLDRIGTENFEHV
jgi:hypothetical protein